MQLIATPTFGYTDAQTGHFSPMETQKNLIVYQAADIVAGLLAGNMSCKLSHMYFQYQNVNGSVSVTPTLTQSSGIADFKAITGGAPYQDYLRVPIITTPMTFQSPSGSPYYQSNGVYVTASSASSPTMLGESPAHNYFASSGANGPSQIFAIALVSAGDPNSSAADKVFSRLVLSTPYPVLSGSYPTIFWSLQVS